MTMLDVALGSACRSLDNRCNGAITVEMKVNFLHPVKDEMRAYGCATKIGKSLIFSEGIIKEHQHVRSAVGIFDVSHMGQFSIFGNEKDYLALEQIVPIDLKSLKVNQSKIFCFNE